MKGREYINELADVVTLPDHMSISLIDFARRIRVYIDIESNKVAPDNALIALLADAARLVWEQIRDRSL